MRVWRKRPEKETSERGVARAALAGASREELLQEALHALRRAGGADRVGVWMETDANGIRQGGPPTAFYGLVWDRENEETPPEWANLSVEAPLPEELLTGGKSVEQDLQAFPDRLIFGPLVELRRALWIPIESKGQLRGIILAGSRKKDGVVSRHLAEGVAAELALAIGLEDEQKLVRARVADLGIVRQALESQVGHHSTEILLAGLVKSCTRAAANGDGPGATFAVIGALRERPENQQGESEMEFRWSSGDEGWTHAIAIAPLSSVWRRALEVRRVIGSEPQVSWAKGSIARVVAFPLEAEGQLLGTLVAGLCPSAISLTTLDRLELRAQLAAATLLRRKQSEAASSEAEWQQAVLDSSGEAVLLLDESGRIVASSPGARALAGQIPLAAEKSPASMDARLHLAKLFCGPDRERIEAWLQRTLRGNSAARSAPEDLLPAELQHGGSVRLRLLAPAAGRGAAILLERLTVQEEARPGDRAETELQSVLEWLEEGVLLFDTQENVRAMNTRFAQIAGLAPEESGSIKTLDGLIGRLETQAADPQRFAERWRELARRIEGGVREELQMARPAPRILERAARPVLDAVGRQLGRVEIYRDLTAQRVFQSKLLQTEKLAALGQMVSGIAHELSNPLTSILGYAQRLLVRQDAIGRTQEARQIYQEAERASTILRQLLLNARETLPEQRMVSLNQIVSRAMELQRFSLAAGKIRVEIDLDPLLPFVYGDAGHLQQVLMNLVGNAQQAIEQQGQGGTIRLRTERIGERRVLLEVEDDGPGIPQAILARIFDPFFTTKPAGVGTGLGLAIVLSIVREHGGQVHVLSPPRGGAIFQVELPAAAARRQEGEAVASSLEDRRSELPETVRPGIREDASATPFASGRGSRVLVVEDEPTVARLIADVLEDEGLYVDVLLDGRAALDRAAKESYDLVICDMKMPGLDGQHFYKSLVRAGNPLREHFLFVTGDIVAAQTREFLERNQLPHVAKPFRVEELTEKVRRVLGDFVHREPAAAPKKNVARNG